MKRFSIKRVVLVLAVLVAGVAWLLWERCGLGGCPDVGRLAGYLPDRASVVLDRRGTVLARLFAVRYPLVPLDSLPPYVPMAFVAIEDQRFWQHDGIDWRRAFGAALANLRSMRIRQGFSTITMQLARNAFPERLPYSRRTISRKFAEMRVARAIEDSYTKSEILELYLNHIYFGGGARGIEAAAREYFAKSATELTLAEAALLAGMVTAPNGLNPRLNPVLAYQRRWVVLNVMWRLGLITREEANEADDAPLVTAEGTIDAGHVAPYFVEEVRHTLERVFGPALYADGYTIHTTLDAGVQAVAAAELRDHIDLIEAGEFGAYGEDQGDGGGDGSGRESAGRADAGAQGAGAPRSDRPGDANAQGALQGAVVVLEAATGDVLAMVGGRDFGDSRFNRVRARRQAGGTLKPFIYAAALENGYTPIDRVDDSPLHRVMAGGQVWTPRNLDERYEGPIPLRKALVRSSNVAAVRLAEEVGIETVAATAERMGLAGPLPRVPALAVGTADVSLLSLAAAYAAFANLGRRPEPRLITRVVDAEGTVIWEQPVQAHAVLDAGVAFLVTDMLRELVDRGPAAGVREAGYQGPAAGVTGTSANAVDYWFVGFTPSRVAAIWVGHDMPRPILHRTPSDRVLPTLWGRIMSRSPAVAEAPWAPPPSVAARSVDGMGRVYAVGCPTMPEVRTEYFLLDNVPSGTCSGPVAPPSAPLPVGDDAVADSLAVPATDRTGGPG